MKSNNKGFTLIELLVVIVILLGISLVAVPNIQVTIQKKNQQILQDEIDVLVEQAEIYISANKRLYNCIVNKGYLSLDTMAEKKHIQLKKPNKNHGFMMYDESSKTIVWSSNHEKDDIACDDKL